MNMLVDLMIGDASFCIESHLFSVSTHGGRYKLALWGLSYKSTSPSHESSALMT